MPKLCEWLEFVASRVFGFVLMELHFIRHPNAHGTKKWFGLQVIE